MLQVGHEVPGHARDQIEIALLAIAHCQADENAEDLGIALGAQNGIGGIEAGRILDARLLDKTRLERRGQLAIDIAAGVFQQGDQVIGRMADQRVLEVQKADTGFRLAVRQMDQVFRMEVAQDEARRAGFQALESLLPELAPFFLGGGIQFDTRVAAQIPVHEEIGLGHQGGLVIGQERPGPATGLDRVGKAGAMDRRQHIHGAGIDRAFVQLAGQAPGEKVIAQIFQQQEAVVEVLREDFRCREAALAQGVGQACKGDQIGAGQPGHGIIAQGLALFRRRVGRTGRRFCRSRRVHQHGRTGTVHQTGIAPRRGVTRQGLALGPAPPGLVQKGVQRAFTIRCRQLCPPSALVP